MMLPEAVRAGLAQMRAEARKAGYWEGYADGEAAGREAERAALIAALAAEVLEDRQRDGVASPANTGAPGPSPVAVAGALPPPVPDAPLPSPAACVVPAGVVDGGGVKKRSTWQTVARAARLRAIWGDVAWTVQGMRRELAGMEGAAMPSSHLILYRWAAELGLGARRASVPPVEGPVEAPEPAAAAPESAGLAGEPAEVPSQGVDAKAQELGAADEVPAPDGLRETPQLVRARALLAMGLQPPEILRSVRLSAIEAAALRAAHAERAAA
jgi:hypothetical protein